MSVGLNVPILASLHQSRADAHLQTWGAGVHVVSGLLVAETRTWDMFHLDHVVCIFCEGHIVCSDRVAPTWLCMSSQLSFSTHLTNHASVNLKFGSVREGSSSQALQLPRNGLSPMHPSFLCTLPDAGISLRALGLRHLCAIQLRMEFCCTPGYSKDSV